MSIFKPTYLYIKQHSVTGKLYFGKTVKNPEEYLGSGRRWTSHINKHGQEHVINLWYCLFLDRDSISEFALNFSKQHNIVESEDWLNLMEEDGLSGGCTLEMGKQISITLKEKYKSGELVAAMKYKIGMLNHLYGKKRPEHSELMKIKMKGENNSMYGKSHTEETKQKWKDMKRNAGENNGMYGKFGELHHCFGRKRSPEEVEKYASKTRGRPQTEIICPHCGTSGGNCVMKRWHFDNCKLKPQVLHQ